MPTLLPYSMPINLSWSLRSIPHPHTWAHPQIVACVLYHNHLPSQDPALGLAPRGCSAFVDWLLGARPSVQCGPSSFLSQSFQFLSLSTAFTQHAFNSPRLLRKKTHKRRVLKQWVHAMTEIGCYGSSNERHVDQQGLPRRWRQRM